MATAKQKTFIVELVNQIRAIDADAVQLDKSGSIVNAEGLGFPCRGIKHTLRGWEGRMDTREASKVIDTLKKLLKSLEAQAK